MGDPEKSLRLELKHGVTNYFLENILIVLDRKHWKLTALWLEFFHKFRVKKNQLLCSHPSTVFFLISASFEYHGEGLGSVQVSDKHNDRRYLSYLWGYWIWNLSILVRNVQ